MQWSEQLPSLLSHALALATFGMAVLLVARLFSDKRQPGATFAWLLLIALVPYLGIPLFLIFGGRKIRKLANEKSPLQGPAQPTPGPVSASFRPHFAGAYPIRTDNRVRFLDRGEDTYGEFLRQIDSSKASIEIVTFILGRDETGRSLIDRLAAKARSGVQVRLLLDGLGCLSTAGRFSDPLRLAGGRVERFMPVLPIQSRWSANLRNHRKIAVFDGCRAIVGGHNLAKEYLGPEPERDRWIDFGMLVEGSAAIDLRRIFLADWEYATEEQWSEFALESDAKSNRGPQAPRDLPGSSLQVLASGPDVQDDTLHEAILSLVQEADSSVRIVTPYFVPDEVLFRSLMVKARTGRQVHILVPERSNHRIADWARLHFLRELQRAGAIVRLYQGPMLHAKALVVDDRLGMVGSVNMDARSLLVNFEVGVFLHSPEEVLGLAHWASRLENASRSFGNEAGEEKPTGFGGELLEDLARLLAPLL